MKPTMQQTTSLRQELRMNPRLYQAMVDSAKQLNGTLGDLNRLVQQWEQEGVTLKIK